MKNKTFDLNKIIDLINSCEGPVEYKTLLIDYLNGKRDALREVPFGHFLFYTCKPKVLRAILQKAIENACTEEHDIVIYEELKAEFLNNHNYILKRPADFVLVLMALIKTEIFNEYAKLSKGRGCKGLFVGVLLLMHENGYFRENDKKGRKITKTDIWRFMQDHFDVGDAQEFNRKKMQEINKNAALEKVPCI